MHKQHENPWGGHGRGHWGGRPQFGGPGGDHYGGRPQCPPEQESGEQEMFGGHHGHGDRHRHKFGPGGGFPGFPGFGRGGFPGGPGGFGPAGFGRGGGRGERFLEQGDLRWLVLDLIAAQPRHGYEIIKAIEEMLGGAYSPSPGVIYPTLTFLEETGLIDSAAQGNKKLYSITDEGTTALVDNADALNVIKARIGEVKSRFGGAPAPELARAMGNLQSALQIRLHKGELTPEALAAITAAIDKAACEIERS